MSASEPTISRAGFCAIVGLPNVGKSTLLNRVLGARLAAVSAKPQTTRHRMLGVQELAMQDGQHAQIAWVDTPGVQDGRGPLRKFMQREALSAGGDADVSLLLIDATDRGGRLPVMLTNDDAAPLAQLLGHRPITIGLNKVDRVAKPDLLPLIEAWHGHFPNAEVIPMSAATGDNVDRLMEAVARSLPPGGRLFPPDTLTDRPERFLVAELIREQLYHQLGKELPYACAVQIEAWNQKPGKPDVAISAVIVVERDSQKAIVVGRGGSRIKELGIAARAAVAELLEHPVHLKLFVKVVEGWSTRATTLAAFGYADAHGAGGGGVPPGRPTSSPRADATGIDPEPDDGDPADADAEDNV